jgi:dTDP-4-dehydrorhamnose 3,5-epimerase
MKTHKCELDGILLMEPGVHVDERGFFLESFEAERYRKLGIVEEFVQGNHSRSRRGVLRGLHFTRTRPQSQILTVMRGRIFDVVVDIRRSSGTFGKWFGTELSDESTRQIYMAHGFAHGFLVLSDWADLHYMVSQRYDGNDEGGLIWNDEDVNIRWPCTDPILSERDRRHPRLKDIRW